MDLKISADMLYNYAKCPHRAYLDLFGDPDRRDPETAFMRLLWERGIDFEKKVMAEMKQLFLDLSTYSGLEKEMRTRKALKENIPLIYGGRLSTNDLVGEPDLLIKKEDGYIAGDIKSGSGMEGENHFSEGKLKLHYAIQLGLYIDILEQLNYSCQSKISLIYDIHGKIITYHLEEQRKKYNQESWWKVYQQALSDVKKITEQKIITTPAHSSICKLCHWRSNCLRNLIKIKDLTLIPELGRKKREILWPKIKNFSTFAKMPFSEFLSGKKTIFSGISIDTLQKYHARAKLLAGIDTQPYAKNKLKFPKTDTELFFDVETDPMHDFCYLHGFLERHHQDITTEKYVAFFADNMNEKEEERVFIDAWHYIRQYFPCTIYYYSPYEKTIWKNLCQKYPEIMSLSDLESFFKSPLIIDLYSNIIRKFTEWPTYSHSIKDLAKYLGFRWRDKTPSGAESIEWYQRWIEIKDSKIKERILQYNEDDCIAMRVLLEGIKALPIKYY